MTRRGLLLFTWPMALTMLRLALVPVFLYLLTLGTNYRLAALGVIAIMALSDMLDGHLARKLNQVSKLGTILDPVADKLLVSGSMLVLTFPRFAPAGFAIPWPILWGVYQKDLCVLIGALVVKHELGKVQINANRYGKLNTITEIALLASTLMAPELVHLSPSFAAFYLWSLWHLTVLATAASAMGYSYEGARQLRAARASASVPVSPPLLQENPDAGV